MTGTILLIMAFILLVYNGVFMEKGAAWELVVADPRSEVVYHRISAQPADVFTLSYRHSVSNSMVYGTFELTEEGFILPRTTTFSSFGPGLPWLDDSVDHTVEEGQIIVYHDEPPRESLRLWVTTFTGETLTLHGQTYPLSGQEDGPLLVEITLHPAERRSPFSFRAR